MSRTGTTTTDSKTHPVPWRVPMSWASDTTHVCRRRRRRRLCRRQCCRVVSVIALSFGRSVGHIAHWGWLRFNQELSACIRVYGFDVCVWFHILYICSYVCRTTIIMTTAFCMCPCIGYRLAITGSPFKHIRWTQGSTTFVLNTHTHTYLCCTIKNNVLTTHNMRWKWHHSENWIGIENCVLLVKYDEYKIFVCFADSAII